MCIAGILLLPVPAAGQLAATVPSSNPVYAIVDEISASLPVPGIIAGQRPWSRREIARIALAFQTAAQARKRDPAQVPLPERIAQLVDSLRSAYDSDIHEITGAAPSPDARALLRFATAEATGTNALPRRIPSNGLGEIDAITNPIVEPNWGRPVAHGTTVDLELAGEAAIGSHLAIAAQPRLTWMQPEGQSGYKEAGFQRLYARATLLNVGIEAGLDEVLWGQAGDRGLLLSANPRPLHAITIVNDTAITLPWLLRSFGPMRVGLMVADLGKDQNFPGAKLISYKASITPTPRLELGAALMDEMWGKGAPRCSLACGMKDLFPYVLWIIHPASDPLATNKVAQGELRYRVPELAGLTLTYEGDLDDFDLRRIRSMLWDNTAHVIGARFDRLTPDGRLGLDLQFHHTPLTLYEHYQYTSGLTYRQAIFGDPLGVHGAAAYGTLIWRQTITTRITLSAAAETRDPSTYYGDTPRNRYVLNVKKSSEDRGRVYLGMDRDVIGTGLGYSLLLGIEDVHNNAFSGTPRTNGIAQLTFRRYF